jgi:hypothetical protein
MTKPRIAISGGGGGAGITTIRKKDKGASSHPSSHSSSFANIIGTTLTRAIERMSSVIDDAVNGMDGQVPWLPLCNSTTAKAWHDDDGVVDVTSATASTTAYDDTVSFDHPPAINDDDRAAGNDVGGRAYSSTSRTDATATANDNETAVAAATSSSAPPPPSHANFATWLSSKEFDASAIVWNGDGGEEGPVVVDGDGDGDGDGEGGYVDFSPRFPPDVSRTVDEDGGGVTMPLTPASPAGRVAAVVEGGNPNEWMRRRPRRLDDADHLGGGGGDDGIGCSALDALLPAALGCAWEGMGGSNWKCWEIGDGDGGTTTKMTDDAVDAPSSLASERRASPSRVKVKKDSSWALDNLGVSPIRDRAMWRTTMADDVDSSTPRVENDDDEENVSPASAEIASTMKVPSGDDEDGNDGRPSDDVGTGWDGGTTRLVTPTPNVADVVVVSMTTKQPTKTSTMTTTDLSVATPLVGEDISIASRPYPQFAPYPRHIRAMNSDDRSAAHASLSGSCTYSISPPRRDDANDDDHDDALADVAAWPSHDDDAGPTAVPAEGEADGAHSNDKACDDDGKTSLMDDFRDRHGVAGGKKKSTKQSSPADRRRWRMRRKNRSMTAS